MIRYLRGAGFIRPIASMSVAAGLATIALASPAAAWEPLAIDQCATGTVFESPEVDLLFHMAGFTGTATQNAELTDAVNAVVDQFNSIGGTSAQVNSVSYTASPSEYGVPHGDSTPTIHVTFVDGLPEPSGETLIFSPCPHTEAHMFFKDIAVEPWNFGTPDGAGSASDLHWFEAGSQDLYELDYFRITFLHELLHAFGLDHATHDYAITNYENKVWANREPDGMLMPLPDDVAGLRKQYPADGLRHDIALFNSWIRHGSREDLPGDHEFLCAPSLGARMSSGPFTEHCGVGGDNAGSTEVCEGDFVNMRVTIANYSTIAMTMKVRAALSTDPYSGADDVFFPKDTMFTMGPAQSRILELRWPAPAFLEPGADYYLIVDIHGWENVKPGEPANLQTLVSDWTPLTGKIQACS